MKEMEAGSKGFPGPLEYLDIGFQCAFESENTKIITIGNQVKRCPKEHGIASSLLYSLLKTGPVSFCFDYEENIVPTPVRSIVKNKVRFSFDFPAPYCHLDRAAIDPVFLAISKSFQERNDESDLHFLLGGKLFRGDGLKPCFLPVIQRFDGRPLGG
nr:hypothetical protein [Mesoterricola silvestris]